MKEKKFVRKEAIALSYNPQKNSGPSLVAKGKGKIAENILEQAALHDVPIYEDPNLCNRNNLPLFVSNLRMKL